MALLELLITFLKRNKHKIINAWRPELKLLREKQIIHRDSKVEEQIIRK